ncbi:MAG: potassium channel protein [Desulfobacteraceae bacterium]|nr:potassium channel protein [Desulfobacteraceae bacterium]MDH3572480.1 potassium channel protein [Desulfobacteraceae bacterium]MDH3720211.1 potassium channel protein [Desulfobacteraceae bacterium]MDH3835257.1 potassium channel protein [Desulfobacteraceae bacterium]MDH3872905.1 potassium channel protein [Desulfobacteraceae bacterium]
MKSIRQLKLCVLLLLLIILIGVTGYMTIEHWGFLDALYMTVTTFTTVGYSEVHKVSDLGRMFTIFFIIIGVMYFLYIAGVIVQFMVEGQIRTILGRRSLDKKIDRLKNHYIVCGYGRIGKTLCTMLKKKAVDLVVIEKDQDLIPVMVEDKIFYISGDAGDESNLIKAGIQHAKGLIAVLATDTDNVFLVLTARQLNPDLYIMANASRNESKPKLLAAGANRVELPYDMGAVSMAQRIIRPTVTNFLSLALAQRRKDIQMEEIPVSPSSELVNVMLKDSGIRQRYNLIIIAVKKSDDSMLFNPSFEAVIESGDTVIAVGEEENLKKLEKILNPTNR